MYCIPPLSPLFMCFPLNGRGLWFNGKSVVTTMNWEPWTSSTNCSRGDESSVSRGHILFLGRAVVCSGVPGAPGEQFISYLLLTFVLLQLWHCTWNVCTFVKAIKLQMQIGEWIYRSPGGVLCVPQGPHPWRTVYFLPSVNIGVVTILALHIKYIYIFQGNQTLEMQIREWMHRGTLGSVGCSSSVCGALEEHFISYLD